MADWLELAALLSQDRQLLFTRLLEQLDLDIDSDAQDVSEDDLFRDGFVQDLLAEVRSRKQALSTAYPFSFSVELQHFQFTPSEAPADWVYAFTVFCPTHERA